MKNIVKQIDKLIEKTNDDEIVRELKKKKEILIKKKPVRK